MSAFAPSDGFAADLMGDAADRARLAALSETQREGILFERGEARRLAAQHWESQLAFRQQQAEAAQNARLRAAAVETDHSSARPINRGTGVRRRRPRAEGLDHMNQTAPGGIAAPSPPENARMGDDDVSGVETSEEEDLVVSCCVCCVPDEYTDPDDPVLICEGCEINVHQSCYGMAGRALPEGDWYCELCRAGLAVIVGAERVRVADDLSVSLPAGPSFSI